MRASLVMLEFKVRIFFYRVDVVVFHDGTFSL